MPGVNIYRVEWARTAVSDLAAIISHIAQDDINTAFLILKRIEETTGKLKTMPLRGRIVPELAAFGIQVYRQLIYSPWRIICRVSGKKVNVLAVLDSRRNLEDILLERLVR